MNILRLGLFLGMLAGKKGKNSQKLLSVSVIFLNARVKNNIRFD